MEVRTLMAIGRVVHLVGEGRPVKGTRLFRRPPRASEIANGLAVGNGRKTHGCSFRMLA